MKTFAACLLGMVVTMSTAPAAELPSAAPFGRTKDGTPVEAYTLKNSHGLMARVMTRGATLVELHVPDRNGTAADVVFGFDDVAGYESEANQYFGCTTGRVCNRIGNAQFVLDGTTYKLAANDGDNTLHGGVSRSLDKVVWAAEPLANERGQGVRFAYTSPDGEEGFPGTLACTVTYFVSNDRNNLRISYEATTDRATPVNLTNHAYFNLSGHGSESILGHELRINARQVTPTDDKLIPTGELASVNQSPVDFRQPQLIGARIEELTNTPYKGYDHNFVLNEPREDQPLRLAAVLKDPASGRIMTVRTTEPGVQFYSGNFLSGQTGKGGKTYAHRSACCLETQHFPDSVNQPNFPTTILQPGQTYESRTLFAFTAE
jgi:aldose 1-epimerase